MTATASITHARDYAAMLNGGAAFALANYGDGEWSCILGADGRNCDGHDYTPELRDALRRTIEQPGDYLYGSNPGRKLLDQSIAYLAAAGTPAINWVDKEILPSANCRGELGPFIAALRRRRLLMVGPRHLRALPRLGVLQPVEFVEVPAVNCFADRTRIGAEVYLKITMTGATAVCFSASMLTNVLVHELWPSLIGASVSLIDCGALWDPYCGVFSRKGYRKPGIAEVLARNLAEAEALR